MNRRLLFAALLAVAAAFLASQSPDGLDSAAETLGFAARAKAGQAAMPDYRIEFMAHPRLSTAAAGLCGLAAVYALFRFAGKLLGARRREVSGQ